MYWSCAPELRLAIAANLRVQAALQRLASTAQLELPSPSFSHQPMAAPSGLHMAPENSVDASGPRQGDWTGREAAFLQCQVQAWAQHCLAEFYGLCGAESPLGLQLAQLLLPSDADGDVTFVLEGGRTRLRLHQALLAARCPVLARAAPQQRLKVSAGSGRYGAGGAGVAVEVRMGPSVSASCFRAAIEYLYTGQARLVGHQGREGGADETRRALGQLARALELHELAALAAGTRPHGALAPLRPMSLSGALLPRWAFAARAPAGCAEQCAEGHFEDGSSSPCHAPSLTTTLTPAPTAAPIPSASGSGVPRWAVDGAACLLPPAADVLLAVANVDVAAGSNRAGLIQLSECTAVDLASFGGWPPSDGTSPAWRGMPGGATVLVPAHRCVLRARVEYFAVLFSERWEDRSERLTVDNHAGQPLLPVVKLPAGDLTACMLLLNFVYSGSLVASSSVSDGRASFEAEGAALASLVNAAVLAELLTLPEMERQCLAALQEGLQSATVECAAAVLTLAWQQERGDLMDLAYQVIAAKPGVLVRSFCLVALYRFQRNCSKV